MRFPLFAVAVIGLLSAASAQAAPDADIVILGEVHDNAASHQGQANALRALAPKAVVFEMLTAEQAAAANANPADLPAIWAEGAWPDYALYAPIFDALGSATIVGAAAPRSEIAVVYTDGAAGLFGPDAAQYGLTEPLPAAQQSEREDLQFAAHCEAMPRNLMAGMVDVQRYRDAVFARAALTALSTHGGPVAVIAGNGHARTDWGIPAAIKRAAPEVRTHAIGFVEHDTGTPFDDIRLVPPAQRGDPCAALLSD
ncbi:ChaN family lipoprotein [Phaeobacter sp.]|uniref:ChaN family lipoprotein n=1 Tax=Phaeobacter sp. TaxID=1902409 RepID=UPI0025CF8784|nr:ChaN family lipoprotein [Phaeobacter sp.]